MEWGIKNQRFNRLPRKWKVMIDTIHGPTVLAGGLDPSEAEDLLDYYRPTYSTQLWLEIEEF
jgi:phosphoribosylanthranilate isomerase